MLATIMFSTSAMRYVLLLDREKGSGGRGGREGGEGEMVSVLMYAWVNM